MKGIFELEKEFKSLAKERILGNAKDKTIGFMENKGKTRLIGISTLGKDFCISFTNTLPKSK